MRSFSIALFVLLPACSSLIGSRNVVHLDVLDSGDTRAQVESVLGDPVAQEPTPLGVRATYRYAPRPPKKVEYLTLDDHAALLGGSLQAFSNAGRGIILWPFVYGGVVIVGETFQTGRVLVGMVSGKRFLAGRIYTVQVEYDLRGGVVSFKRESRKATADERRAIFARSAEP